MAEPDSNRQRAAPPWHWPWRWRTVVLAVLALPFVFVLDTIAQIAEDAVGVVVLLAILAISVAVPLGILWLLDAPIAWYAVAAPAGLVAAVPLARWYARWNREP